MGPRKVKEQRQDEVEGSMWRKVRVGGEVVVSAGRGRRNEGRARWRRVNWRKAYEEG